MTQQALPATLPADTTPVTFSGTPMTAFLLDRNATAPILTAVTTSAAAIAAAVALTVTALTVALPAGTVLDFGGVKATLTASSPIGDTSLDVAALSGAIASGTVANYTNMREIPLAEDFTAALASNEESVQIHGRFTPKRTTTGYDFTSTIKTIAPISDPTIKALVTLGTSRGEARMLFQFADGFCILATVLIGSPKPTAAVGSTQRYEFMANLCGKLFWLDRNDAAPAWLEIGALAA